MGIGCATRAGTQAAIKSESGISARINMDPLRSDSVSDCICMAHLPLSRILSVALAIPSR